MIGKPVIELVVIRNIAMHSAVSTSLFEWLQEVVDNGCDNRRDVRVCHSVIFID